MKSLVEGLPPEIAQQISPEWHKNEAEYWAKRQELLSRYEGQWIGFAGGKVVAFGSSPVEVLHAARESTSHPFLTCVGREDEPCRVRQAVFQYDTSYPGEPMPVIAAEFRKHQYSSGMTMDTVIPDTGADATVLPWADCQQLHLDPSDAVPGLIGGIVGSSAATIVFQVWVHLAERTYPCRLHVDFQGSDRILGRDVLNRMDVLFRGLRGEVVVDPDQ